MLKELKARHRTIIQMSFSGFSNNEIAERLEMSPPAVSQILRSPLGQAYLGGLNDKAQEDTLDVRKKLTSLNKNALATFERILDPRQKAPHAVQATIAKDVLDRNGYKPPDKLNIDMSLSTKTDQEIDAEIAAMQDSIQRTYKQDPVKEIAETSSGSNSDEADPDYEPLTNVSSEASEESTRETLIKTNNKTDSYDDDASEDPFLNNDIINKLPVDAFDSSSKIS